MTASALGNPDALSLPARELVGVPGGGFERESHDIEKLGHLFRNPALPHDDKTLADDIGDGHPGVERARRGPGTPSVPFACSL